MKRSECQALAEKLIAENGIDAKHANAFSEQFQRSCTMLAGAQLIYNSKIRENERKFAVTEWQLFKYFGSGPVDSAKLDISVSYDGRKLQDATLKNVVEAVAHEIKKIQEKRPRSVVRQTSELTNYVKAFKPLARHLLRKGIVSSKNKVSRLVLSALEHFCLDQGASVQAITKILFPKG